MVAMLASACAVDQAPSPDRDPRQGVYTVRSEVEDETISSEVHRDDVLVAVATLDADAAVLTLVESGKELVSAPPEDYDPYAELSRYESVVAGLSQALELLEAEADGSQLRMADDCDYFMVDGGGGSVCAFSWCGDSCWAYDCGPGAGGYPEVHTSQGCG